MHYRVLSVSFIVGCSQHYVSAPKCRDKTSSDWSSVQPTSGIIIMAKETEREGSQRSGLELLSI